MRSLYELNKARERVAEKYQRAMQSLGITPELSAQEANDAHLEMKKLDVEIDNFKITKELDDLYGCNYG